MSTVSPVIYLDTNHISALARSSSGQHTPDGLSLFRRREAFLAFSVFHMVELSDAVFKSFDDTCILLDSLPIAWALQPPALWDQEVEVALARARGIPPAPVQVFFDNPAEALRHADLGRGLPSAALQAMRESQHLRNLLLNQANDHAKAFDAAKTNAAAVQRPREPVLALIRDYQMAHPERCTPPVLPDVVLDRAGGLAGFPSYEISQELNLTRLRDLRYRTERNDILDEWHAVYAPYVDAMALDRRTAGRVRSTQLPVAAKVTHVLDEVPAIVGR